MLDCAIATQNRFLDIGAKRTAFPTAKADASTPRNVVTFFMSSELDQLASRFVNGCFWGMARFAAWQVVTILACVGGDYMLDSLPKNSQILQWVTVGVCFVMAISAVANLTIFLFKHSWRFAHAAYGLMRSIREQHSEHDHVPSFRNEFGTFAVFVGRLIRGLLMFGLLAFSGWATAQLGTLLVELSEQSRRANCLTAIEGPLYIGEYLLYCCAAFDYIVYIWTASTLSESK